MTFTESNTVEQMILDAATSLGTGTGNLPTREDPPPGWGGSLGEEFLPSRWTYAPQVPRQTTEVMVEPWVREALIALNPEIAEEPERADEVIYALRAILLSVNADGLVRANENFMAWFRGEKTMPFGTNGEHVPVRLVDFIQPDKNRLTVTNQWIYQVGTVTKRFDVVFLVNGLPVVIGEAKTPTRSAVTWFDGAYQINEIYEKEIPAMFVPNVFSFATEGKLLRYGSIRMPIDLWGPWRDDDNQQEGELHFVRATVQSLLRPEVVLDIGQNFTLFATDKKHRRIKIIARYQQYETTNKIVARVVAGYPKKGLIWHFQGSGKSLLMVFAAQKLRLHPRLGNPTVLIVVDRIDLDTQITATFNAADVPNMVPVGDRKQLQQLLAQDVRKVLITTIHKFAEAEGVLNDRKNIIAMVDEAHRTQEGDLGRKMRAALPNSFLFGLTGTPINRADRNTFWAFGADEDAQGYMSRYSFQDSIRDKATLPLHFEAPAVKLKIDKAAIDEAYKQITGNLSEQDRDDLAKRAAKMAVLVKNPERVRAVVEHIVGHFQAKVEPNGFKAQVVVFDRECCVLYKKVMDELIGPDASAIVMSSAQHDNPEWKEHIRDKDAEEKLLDRFRDPADPLRFVIVTSKLHDPGGVIDIPRRGAECGCSHTDDDHVDGKCGQKARKRWRGNHPVHSHTVNHQTDQHPAYGNSGQRQIGIDAKPAECVVGNKHSQSHHRTMAQVDHLHDAPDQTEPHGCETVNKSEQHSVEQRNEDAHGRRRVYRFVMGMASALLVSEGQTSRLARDPSASRCHWM